MKPLKPYRLFALWLLFVALGDVAVLLSNFLTGALILPVPTDFEVRLTLFYSLLHLMSAFYLWRRDVFGWHVATFATLLRIVEGTLFEIISPVPGSAILATGLGLLYNGIILRVLDSRKMRRRFFGSGERPFAFIKQIGAAARIAGISLLGYHFWGIIGAFGGVGLTVLMKFASRR